MKLVYVIEDKERLLDYWRERAEDSQGVFQVELFCMPTDFFDFASKNNLTGDCIVVDRFIPGFDNQEDFVDMLNEETSFKGIKILTSSLFKHGKCPKVKGFDHVVSKKDLIDQVLKILHV